MTEKLIILGAGIMQGPAIKIAKELGFYTIVLDGNSSAPNISMADKFEQIDLKDKESIEAYSRSLQSNCGRIGIMTAGTDFSASVAWVAEKLGLPGIPYETALNASDKSRMRECFKKAGLPSPEFFTITKDNIVKSAKDIPLPFPVVIKPVDNMGSRGCRKVNSIKEYHDAAKAAIDFSRSGNAIVENFMDGPEFSVDAIINKGEITICGLADRHIFFPPYFIEMGHTMPAQIDAQTQNQMLNVFRNGIYALGLAEKNNIGAAKGDIKFTAKGAMIGEIAARLSGGYMSGWTYPYASGVHPVKAAIQMAMGRKPDNLNPKHNWTCAERAFISIPGTVKQLRLFQNSKKPNVHDIFPLIKPGDKVSFPENNVTKCGNIIASAPDRETAILAAENAARSVLIKLETGNRETDKFLSEFSLAQTQRTKSRFPPDAFELSEELILALAKLPETENPNCPSTAAHCSFAITPFPEFISLGRTDYMGRTVEETLEAVRILTGLPLPINSKNAENNIRLGRSFWSALIQGSYQGAVYYIENTFSLKE